MLLACVSFLQFLLIVQGQMTGPCIFINNGDVYDFTTLMGLTFTASSQFYTYSFTPCENGCASVQQNASICQDDNNPVAPVSVFDNTVMWQVGSNGTNITVLYTTDNGGPPMCPSGKPRFATMQFVCDLMSEPDFQLIQEPNLQGCSNPPGYLFTLTCPQACAGYVPPHSPACPFTNVNPCVIFTYNTYAFPGGWTIVMNQNLNSFCGSILFSDYLVTKPPVDTCTNTTVSGNWQMISHIDILFLNPVIAMLQNATSANPIVFFWDDNTNTAVIGPAHGNTKLVLEDIEF